MMLPPDEFDEVEIEPYDVPRGTCPWCGSWEVRHFVVGLPAGPEVMEGDARVGRVGGLCSSRIRPRVPPLRLRLDLVSRRSPRVDSR